MSNAIRMTVEQVEAHNKRLLASIATASAGTAADKIVKQAERTKRFQALGRMAKDKMNKTEAAYAAVLEQRKQLGQIIDYKFHPMNVRLAANTFYEVDFLVLGGDMRLAIHEVKGGFTTEKGQMKIKLCAEALPWFQFLKVSKLAKKDGGGWKVEEF